MLQEPLKPQARKIDESEVLIMYILMVSWTITEPVSCSNFFEKLWQERRDRKHKV